MVSRLYHVGGCGYVVYKESNMNGDSQMDLPEFLSRGPSGSARLLEVMAAISREREFQDRKHGHPSENPHSVGAWLLIAEAELNEAKAACIKGAEGRDNVINEIIQTAATLVACLEQYGVNPLPGRTV